MKLLQLRYFKTVCETRSMTRAASLLHVAQPALGFQIAQLEQELEAKLLTRHSRGAEPTVAGERLYQHAVRILSDVEKARTDIRQLGSAAQNEPLTLGVAPSILLLLGSELLSVAQKVMPSVELGLIEQPSFALAEAVAQGTIDVALVNDTPERTGVVRTPLIVEELLFVTGAANKLPGLTISFREVLQWDLVLAGQQDSIRQRVDLMAKALDMPVRVPFAVQSVSIMKALFVQRPVGGILPYGTVHDQVRLGHLHTAKIRNPAIQRTIYLLRSSRRPSLRNEASFVSFIENLVVKLIDQLGVLAIRVRE